MKPKVVKLNLNSTSEFFFDSTSCQDVVFSKLPDTTPFPPTPVNNELSQNILNNFCVDSLLSVMEESGCAICSTLHSPTNSRWIPWES